MKNGFHTVHFCGVKVTHPPVTGGRSGFTMKTGFHTVHFCGVKVTQPPEAGGRSGFDFLQKLSGKPLVQTHMHACLHTQTNN